MAKPSKHVMPAGGKWSVRSTGAKRATAVFDTQKEAVAKGRELAKASKTELYIHGADGRIRERNSYGHDPYPPKG